MIRSLLRILLMLALAYCLYAGFFFWRQRAILFPGAGVQNPWPVASLPANAEPVRIAATFGAVHGVFLRASGGAERAPVIIFTHGNFEFAEQAAPELATVAAQGVHVLSLEYPGYAGAPGTPTFESLNEASVQAYDWLVARPDVDPTRIIAMGRSIGGGPAAELTRRRKVQALVLMSTLTSVADFARGLWLPPFLVRDPFDNLSRVRDFAGPVLIFHGRNDEIIPFEHGQRLAAQAQRATLVPLECGHNDCPYFDADFLRRLKDFLELR